MNQHETTESNMIMQLCSPLLSIFRSPEEFQNPSYQSVGIENPSGESIFQSTKVHMDVSKNRGFSPQIIPI